MNRRIRTMAAAAACVAALAWVAPVRAQVSTGRVDVAIEGPAGGRLAGVNVQLDGPVAQTQIADEHGQAHFLNLPVGTYTISLGTLSAGDNYDLSLSGTVDFAIT